jgi:hypothetical protein
LTPAGKTFLNELLALIETTLLAAIAEAKVVVKDLAIGP